METSIVGTVTGLTVTGLTVTVGTVTEVTVTEAIEGTVVVVVVAVPQKGDYKASWAKKPWPL